MSEADAGPVPAPVARPQRFQALSHRDFRVLWIGLLFASSTMVFQWYAQNWFLVQTTDSPVALGLLGGIRGLAMVVFSMYGGVLADRMDRRSLLLVTQGTGMAIFAVLAVLVILDLAELWHAFLLIFLSSAAQSIDQPVRQALAPELVPKEDIPNAMALVMAAQTSAFAYFPPLAGVAIDQMGPGGAFALSLLGHAAVIIMLLRLKHRGKPARDTATRSSLLTDARYGMAYAAKQPMVLWPLVMVAVVGALGMPLITSLAALWMKNVLFVGATTYTVIAWIWGMGSLGASVYLASRRDIAWKGKIFIVSSIMFGASLILFGFTRSVPLAAASWFVNGICSSANNITSLAIIQGVIPNEVRGRVMGLLTLSRSLSMMAAAPLGVVAQLTSMAVMVPSMAILCTVIVTGMAVLIPTLRRLDEEEEKPVPAVAS